MNPGPPLTRRGLYCFLAACLLALAACAGPTPPLDEDFTQNPGQAVAARARALAGAPYRYGGADPQGGFDCSGLVYHVYKSFGIDAPRTTGGLVKAGRWVKRAELAPGDLVFFITDKKGGLHVGIYLGGGRFVHAPSTGKKVRVSRLGNPYYHARYHTARRLGY